MSRQTPEISDRVDERQVQWRSELPDVDTEGMGIFGRMRLITLELRPRIEEVFAKHGIDGGEFDVLATLLRSGAPYRLRPTELYRSLLISSGGLTDRLSRLTQAGLVIRSPAPDDGRSSLVELTSVGRELAERAFREDMALEAQCLEGLSSQDRSDLQRLLRRLALQTVGKPDDSALED